MRRATFRATTGASRSEATGSSSDPRGSTTHRASTRQSRTSRQPSRFTAKRRFSIIGVMSAQPHGFDGYHGYVGVQRRGVIALPADLRQRLHLDEPGAQLEITERPDGVLELRPALPVPADQAWFWTEQWQQREREVDEHVAAGRVVVHETGEDFLAHLDDLDAAE